MKQRISKNHILEARARKNLKQSELAELVGVAKNTVSTWERGLCQPRMAQAIRLADYFGLVFEDLFEVKDN